MLEIGYKGEDKLKKIVKVVLCMFLALVLTTNFDLQNVLAKEAPSRTESVQEKSKQEVQEKTKGQEYAQELAQMPLSGKSPLVYAGLIAISVIALGVLISVGKSSKKNNTFK